MRGASIVTVPSADILPDHILCAILVFAIERLEAKKNIRLMFRANNRELQAIFHSMRSQQDSRLLEPFVYSDQEPAPYSLALNQAMAYLLSSGLVARRYADTRILSVEPAGHRFLNKMLKRDLQPDDLSALNVLAGRFLERVDTTSSID